MDIKQQIVSEYLSGNFTERDLSAKYGFSNSSIHRWVSDYRLKNQIASLPVQQQPDGVLLPDMQKAVDATKEELLKEVTALRQQLQQERLQVELLNAIIDIAEKELQVPIRKKPGARQSNK